MLYFKSILLNLFHINSKAEYPKLLWTPCFVCFSKVKQTLGYKKVTLSLDGEMFEPADCVRSLPRIGRGSFTSLFSLLFCLDKTNNVNSCLSLFSPVMFSAEKLHFFAPSCHKTHCKAIISNWQVSSCTSGPSADFDPLLEVFEETNTNGHILRC